MIKTGWQRKRRKWRCLDLTAPSLDKNDTGIVLIFNAHHAWSCYRSIPQPRPPQPTFNTHALYNQICIILIHSASLRFKNTGSIILFLANLRINKYIIIIILQLPTRSARPEIHLGPLIALKKSLDILSIFFLQFLSRPIRMCSQNFMQFGLVVFAGIAVKQTNTHTNNKVLWSLRHSSSRG